MSDSEDEELGAFIYNSIYTAKLLQANNVKEEEEEEEEEEFPKPQLVSSISSSSAGSDKATIASSIDDIGHGSDADDGDDRGDDANYAFHVELPSAVSSAAIIDGEKKPSSSSSGRDARTSTRRGARTSRITALPSSSSSSSPPLHKVARTDIKPRLKAGTKVYAAWWPDKQRNDSPSWYPGTIKACREVAAVDIKNDDERIVEHIDSLFLETNKDYITVSYVQRAVSCHFGWSKEKTKRKKQMIKLRVEDLMVGRAKPKKNGNGEGNVSQDNYKINYSSSDYGPLRLYNIEYDDGDEFEGVEDRYVFTKQDYTLNIRGLKNHTAVKGKATSNKQQQQQNGWMGVKNVVDSESKDEWASTVGWYNVMLMGGQEQSFSFLIDALRAYDASVIHIKGATNTQSCDLNLSEEFCDRDAWIKSWDNSSDEEDGDAYICSDHDGDGTVHEPPDELLKHIRSMSTKKQRKHVAVGLRVKICFDDTSWYGGAITSVIDKGRQIEIEFDDGSTELSNFPDNDIIVDNSYNGRHAANVVAFVCPRVQSKSSGLIKSRWPISDGRKADASRSTPEMLCPAESITDRKNTKRDLDRDAQNSASKPQQKKRKYTKSICSHSLCSETAVYNGICSKHGSTPCIRAGCTFRAFKGENCWRHARPICSHEGCNNQSASIQGAVCDRHGGGVKIRRKCNHPGCMNFRQHTGFCKRQFKQRKGNPSKEQQFTSPMPICSHESCNSHSLQRKGGYYASHSGKIRPKCNHPGCTQLRQNSGFCYRHFKEHFCTCEGPTTFPNRCDRCMSTKQMLKVSERKARSKS